MKQLLLSLAAMLLPASCHAEAASPPVEAGKVAWSRDLDAALVSSAKTGKPLLVLFQEIPGCAGCQQFGREVMSNPLIVEAI